MTDPTKLGRRSSDADLAVVIERLDTQDETLDRILVQTSKTNGRVSELEVKDRVREDREEQARIAKTAAEVAARTTAEKQRSLLARWELWVGIAAIVALLVVHYL